MVEEDYELEREKYRKQIFEYEIDIKKQQLNIKFFIVVFSILSLVGFLSLLYFINDYTISGYVIGQQRANIYAGMVFIIFFILWLVLLVEWFRVKKEE